MEELRPLNASKGDRLYEDLEPRRARNLVWKAEKVKEPESKELDAVPVQTQQQEAALQKAMAEDEKAPGEASWAEDVEESSDDEVHLGEVLASQTGVKMAGAANARGGLAAPAPQALVASSRSHDCAPARASASAVGEASWCSAASPPGSRTPSCGSTAPSSARCGTCGR